MGRGESEREREEENLGRNTENFFPLRSAHNLLEGKLRRFFLILLLHRREKRKRGKRGKQQTFVVDGESSFRSGNVSGTHTSWENSKVIDFYLVFLRGYKRRSHDIIRHPKKRRGGSV
jgi:hypothetical protein